MTPTRRALTLAGIGTIGFSLVLSIAPALAAPNKGTMKVYEVGGSELGNEPHVCSFYAEFTGTDVTGGWTLYDWSNDQALVGSGTFSITGTGSWLTPDFTDLPASHYRLEGTISDSNSPKVKTLWIDGDCYADESSPSQQESSPSEESAPSQDESSPSGEASPSQQESSPSEESAPSQGESSPSQEEAPASEEEAPTPTQAPAENEQPEQHSNQPAATPEQELQHGTGTPGTTLPDTAIPVTQSGVLATIGLLLIIAAHAGSRRERELPLA